MTPASPRIGVVVALNRELRALAEGGVTGRQPETAVACAGLGAGRAGAAARRLHAAGAGALIGIGLAAGLKDGLDAGAVIVARSVIAPDGSRIPTDAAWTARALDRLAGLGVQEGDVAGSDRVLAAPTDKAELGRATGALVADMESHGLARVAAELEVPLLIVRVVCDPRGVSVPPWLADTIADDGRLSAELFIEALSENWRDIGRLLRLAPLTWRAERALSGVATVLTGCGFALR